MVAQVFRIISNFTDLIQFHLIWQNFLWDRVYRYHSLKQGSDNFCVLFTNSIKRPGEIRKFPVSQWCNDAKEMYKIA